jgi:hypothetical protein
MTVEQTGHSRFLRGNLDLPLMVPGSAIALQSGYPTFSRWTARPGSFCTREYEFAAR